MTDVRAPRLPLFLSTAALFLLACGSGAPPEATWHGGVQSVLARNCLGCHQQGSIGSLDFSTYDHASALAGAIAGAAATRRMPPWMPGDGPVFRDDRRLSIEDIRLLTRWAEAGAPEGTPSGSPETPRVATIRHDTTLTMDAEYEPNAARSDDYRCFVLDPNVTARRAVTGFDVVPGNRRIVHHVLLFAASASTQSKLRQLESEDARDGYECFGGPRVDANMLGGWVPGSGATVFPDGTGIEVAPGSLLVMQIHYNTSEVRNATDRTTVHFQHEPAGLVTPASIIPILNASFVVPPGEVRTVTNTEDLTGLVPSGIDVEVHGVLPHMHVFGKSIRVLRERGGEITPFVDIPKWDFQWQEFYFFDEPVVVRSGDRLTIECTFDNRPQNQPVVNGTRMEPRTLRWGEGTFDEMCLNYFYGTAR